MTQEQKINFILVLTGIFAIVLIYFVNYFQDFRIQERLRFQAISEDLEVIRECAESMKEEPKPGEPGEQH